MRLVSIPEALERVDETLTGIKGTLTNLRSFKDWDGDNFQKTAKVKKSAQYGTLQAGEHTITLRFSDFLRPISQNYLGKEIIIRSTKAKQLHGVKVKINVKPDQTRETILQISKQAAIDLASNVTAEPIEFPNRSTVPAPKESKPRFETKDIKSMEKSHTNGSTASSPSLPVTQSPTHSSITTTFNPQELTAIRDQAAKLSKETTDPYLKRAYCELAVAAHNLDSCLLRPVR